MGWTYSHNCTEKEQIIEDIIRLQETSGYKLIKKSCSGNELWTVLVDEKTGIKEIALFLLSKNKGTWGYKDIPELAHPYYYKCPKSFLDDVPVQCEAWRQELKTYSENKKKNLSLVKELEIGQTVILKGSLPDRFVISNLSPLLGVAITDGKTYKIIKTRIIEVIAGENNNG